MRLLIFTEAGDNFGLGHLTRCLSIARAFKNKGIPTTFFINGDENVIPFIDGYDYKIGAWYNLIKEMADFRIFQNNLCLIDSYYADYEIYLHAAIHSVLLISIDDTNRLNYPQGIVINGSIGAKELNYKNDPKIKYLLGTEYQALRQEFWRIGPIHIREKISNIFITFGGADLHNLSGKTAKIINQNFKYNLFILIGDKTKIDDKLIKKSNIKIINTLNSKEITHFLKQIDLTISAVGQSIYEFARMGIPTIGIKTTDNQITNVNGWLKHGFINYIGDWDTFEDQDLLNEIQGLNDSLIRKRKSHDGTSLIDGQGSERIVNECLKMMN